MLLYLKHWNLNGAAPPAPVPARHLNDDSDDFDNDNDDNDDYNTQLNRNGDYEEYDERDDHNGWLGHNGQGADSDGFYSQEAGGCWVCSDGFWDS